MRGTAGHSMYTGLETAGHGGQVSMYTGRDTDALGCSAPWGIILGLGRVVVQVSLGWSVCTLGGILVHRVCTLGWILLGTVGWTVCTVYTFGGVVLVLAWMWAPCWGTVSACVSVLDGPGFCLCSGWDISWLSGGLGILGHTVYTQWGTTWPAMRLGVGTRPENNGGTWEPDMVIFRYKVSDIDLSMARLQLIGIISRAPYRQNAFMHKKKNRTLKFLEKTLQSLSTNHTKYNLLTNNACMLR